MIFAVCFQGDIFRAVYPWETEAEGRAFAKGVAVAGAGPVYLFPREYNKALYYEDPDQMKRARRAVSAFQSRAKRGAKSKCLTLV